MTGTFDNNVYWTSLQPKGWTYYNSYYTDRDSDTQHTHCALYIYVSYVISYNSV